MGRASWCPSVRPLGVDWSSSRRRGWSPCWIGPGRAHQPEGFPHCPVGLALADGREHRRERHARLRTLGCLRETLKALARQRVVSTHHHSPAP